MRHLTIPADIPTYDLECVSVHSMPFRTYYLLLLKPRYEASTSTTATAEEIELLMSTNAKLATCEAGDEVELTDDEYAALLAATPMAMPGLAGLLDRALAFRLAMASARLEDDDKGGDDEKHLPAEEGQADAGS